MRYLITGGCGFIGSNLAQAAMQRGHEVTLFDNLYRFGAAQNLEWLKTQGKFQFLQSDIRDYAQVERAVQETRPEVVFHLAGQVAMTTSLENPRLDFEINVMGGNNILEAIRQHAPQAAVIYSSTNKVYGGLDCDETEEVATRYVSKRFPLGYDESIPLDFQSPYGCSKGATDQYMLDYHRMFGLKTVVFRHSSVFGTRQFSTFDQGWVGWFVRQAIEQKRGETKPFTIAGTGKQVRDVLFVSDLVECYFKTIESIEKVQGQAFNLGGGMENSLSLLELFQALESELGIALRFEKLPWRQSDQKIFVADITKVTRLLDWSPKVSKLEGLRSMLHWIGSANS